MLENTELRAIYCREMIKLAEANPRIVTVDADLMRAAGMKPFEERFPDRAFDVGVAEGNMMGVAAGLAAMGFTPVVHSFTPFVTRRTFDQIAISVAYAGLPVKIVGSDPGITAEVNGGTHMSVDDVNLMRGIPNMVIAEPVDEASMVSLLPQMIDHPSATYMRLFRKPPQRVYEPGTKLTLGKASVLRDGTDVAILASGIMVNNAIEAAKTLQAEGISAFVADVHTIKPLDVKMVQEAALRCGAIVTAENHSIIGGLGSAAAECITSLGIGAKLKRIGFQDRFGLVGFRPYLEEEVGLTPSHIVQAVREVLTKI